MTVLVPSEQCMARPWHCTLGSTCAHQTCSLKASHGMQSQKLPGNTCLSAAAYIVHHAPCLLGSQGFARMLRNKIYSECLQALEGSRSVLEQELKDLHAQPAGAKAAVKKTSAAIAQGIGQLKGKQSRGSTGSTLSDDELRTERQQLSSALDHLDERIAGIRQEISHGMRADEREMWETNLVMMQVCSNGCVRRKVNGPSTFQSAGNCEMAEHAALHALLPIV